MRNQWIVVRNVIIVFFITGLLPLGSCSSPSAEAKTKSKTETEDTVQAIHIVEIAQMKFSPAELTVKKGDKVIFVNHDMVTHDVTEEKNKAWSSSLIATDQSWVWIATESSSYFCSIHPVMKGKIIVE